jgi:hypothetical protein
VQRLGDGGEGCEGFEVGLDQFPAVGQSSPAWFGPPGGFEEAPCSKTIGVSPCSRRFAAADRPMGPAPITATGRSVASMGLIVALVMEVSDMGVLLDESGGDAGSDLQYCEGTPLERLGSCWCATGGAVGRC